MSEDNNYEEYRVRAQRKWIWILPRRHWGKAVRFHRWTEYTLEELQRRYKDVLEVELAVAASDDRVEIEGRSGGGEWAPVSVEEKRIHALVVAAHATGATEVASRRAGRKKGSGIDTLVRHLRDKEKLRRYPEIIEVLRGSGIPWITVHIEAWGENAIERARGAYARGRAAHGEACEYCGSGLPPELQTAIARRKYP